MALIEAQVSGLPVVATRHAGIKDVVLDGQTGILVDEGDVDGMAEGMVTLANDPRLAGEFGRRVRQRAIERFSLKGSLERLAKLLSNVSNGRVRFFGEGIDVEKPQ